MLTPDPLAPWWRHRITVERHAGTTGYGDDVYATPTRVRGMIDDRRRTVRGPSGDDVISETTVLLPIRTPDVSLGSRVTLPKSHGSRTAVVLAVSRHDGGGQPTPDHLELALT